ncbi:MAG TPA: hypothetical protein VMR21_09990 [Vicinamibacteria bacterium]|nr:hypothetical protein [Vicinamibacteria bacterium]
MTRRLAFARLAAAALVAGTAAVAAAGEPSPPPAARTHLVPGELARVDLARRSIVVKTAKDEAGEVRELEAWTGADTRLIARGRVLRLEDLRPGDRVLLTCADVAGRHEARTVKVVARIAIPTPPPSPAASPSPAPPAAPGGAGGAPFD